MMATSSVHAPNSTWFTDSGVTHHITFDLSNLSLRSEYQGGDKVFVGNGKGLPILNIGTGIIHTPSFDFRLQSILHVPAITSNLLSVHKFVKDNNCCFFFDAHGFHSKDKSTGKIVFQGCSENGLYPFHSTSVKPTTFMKNWF